MKRKYSVICLLVLLTLPLAGVRAQRRVMMYDPEANRPLRDVIVWTDNNRTDTTSILGDVWLPQKFDTLYINKPGFIALRIPFQWVEDTIPLLRDYHHINEVVVYASRKDDFQRAVSRWTKADRTEVELRNPITGIGFNFSDLIDKQRRRDKRNAKKLTKIFNQLDADDNDPIIHSYREALRDRMGER